MTSETTQQFPPKPKKTFEERHAEYLEICREDAQKKMERLDAFVEKNGLIKKIIEINGKKLLLVEQPNLVSIPTKKMESYLQQNTLAEKKGIITNCFEIAQNACKAGVATGRVATRSGARGFTEHANHCINCDESILGTLIAFDLTASVNTDRNQGVFDVFAIRAQSKPELLALLNELYGGDWQQI